MKHPNWYLIPLQYLLLAADEANLRLNSRIESYLFSKQYFGLMILIPELPRTTEDHVGYCVPLLVYQTDHTTIEIPS
jgi:hypothetical protein